MTSLAIYPGTFDPVTLGHMDLVERSSGMFKDVIIAVVEKPEVETLFSTKERVEMLRKVVSGLDNVVVEPFGGLLIDYVRAKKGRILIRGIRAYSDFEYEFQMALTNRKMAPEIETLFMMPGENHSYMSSTIIRELARLGGDTSPFVPEIVAQRLCRRFKS